MIFTSNQQDKNNRQDNEFPAKYLHKRRMNICEALGFAFASVHFSALSSSNIGTLIVTSVPKPSSLL
jgi:hypothetical protein